MGGSQESQGLAEFGVEVFIDQPERVDGFQWDGPEAGVGQQIEDFNVDELFIADLFSVGFHAEDHAGDFIGGFHFDFFAADLLQELGKRRIARQIDGEGF